MIMKRSFSLLLFFFIYNFTFAAIFENGSMEQWLSSSVFPTNWGTVKSVSNTTIVKLDSDVLAGNYALQLQYTLTTGHSRFNSPYFKVSTGRYKLSYLTKGNARLRWIVLSPKGTSPAAPVAGGPNLAASDYTSSGTTLNNSVWVKRECYFDVPENVVDSQYCLHFSINSTVAPYHFCVDNVSVTPVAADDDALWQSELVSLNADSVLCYAADTKGFSIPDFSSAGYAGGGVELPSVPTVLTISAVSGDNTANIQAAIDQVGAMPLVNGIRGALLLKAGLYNISGSIYVKYSGVVLRGEGQGDSPATSTILHATGTDQRTLVYLGNSTSPGYWTSKIGSNIIVTDNYLEAGTKDIHLESVATLAVGDQIILQHDDTQQWLDSIGGGVGDSGATPWTLADNLYIPYNRYIACIDASTNTITLDAPLFYGFRKSLSQSYVYKLNSTSIYKEIGIENLRLDCDYDASVDTTTSTYGTYLCDEAHSWNGVNFLSVENAWAKNVTVIHFGGSSFMCTTTTRTTIDSCSALDPISIITGERRYGFNTSARSQLVLVSNCYARNGRHHYVSNGTTSASGNVFLRCSSDRQYAVSEGHRKWSSGFLYDNYKELSYANDDQFTLGFYNRGSYGTSHGWGMVTGVAWNCDLTAGNSSYGQIVNQRPPTAQNFVIGCNANKIDNLGPFVGPIGYIEGSNKAGKLIPESLYEIQLLSRKKQLTILCDTKSVSGLQNSVNNSTNVSHKFVYNGSLLTCSVEETYSKGNVGIYAISGQLITVCKLSGSSFVIEPENLPKGIYFWKLLSN